MYSDPQRKSLFDFIKNSIIVFQSLLCNSQYTFVNSDWRIFKTWKMHHPCRCLLMHQDYIFRQFRLTNQQEPLLGNCQIKRNSTTATSQKIWCLVYDAQLNLNPIIMVLTEPELISVYEKSISRSPVTRNFIESSQREILCY